MNPIPRILIVEDDPLVRELSADLLSRSGYQVDTAEDGEAGLKTFHAACDHSASYDLVITDNNMPKVSGVELINTLRSEHTMVPIILASGTVPATIRYLELAAVLSKPFFPSELLETVKRVLLGTQLA